MKELYICIKIFKFHLMSIHVIAQGIISIRSFSFRKEAEIKKLFFKKFSIGCQVLKSRLLYSSSQTKRGVL